MQRAVHGATSPEDRPSSAWEEQTGSSFQQELKAHLLLIQRKLDDLGRRLDGNPSRKGSNLNVQAACEDGKDLNVSVVQIRPASSPRRLSSPRQVPPERCEKKTKERPTVSQDGDLEVINLCPFGNSEDGTLGSPSSKATQERNGRSAGRGPKAEAEDPRGEPIAAFDSAKIMSFVAEERFCSEQEYGNVVPSPKNSPTAVPVKLGTRRGSMTSLPSTQIGRRGSVTSSIMSEDAIGLRRVTHWLRNHEINTVRRSFLDTAHLKRMASGRKSLVEQSAFYRFVHGMHFQLLSSFMICLNVVLIGVSSNDRLQCQLNKMEEPAVWESIEAAFVAFFALELVLRIIADRILFVFGAEWKWNMFDMVLVASSILDFIVSQFTIALTDMTTVRVLRFVRFVRIARIARAVRAFHSLRIVVFAIIESLVQLMWCLVVVGIIMYMFGLLFVLGVTEHIASPEWATNAQQSVLLEYYGSVHAAILSLFMTVSGGIDWKEAMKPLDTVHWVYQPIFAAYVFLMVIGVLNVVMGAFVAATAEITNKDRELVVKKELVQLQEYTDKIKDFFEEADTDGSGMLSFAEFQEHLKVPKVAAYFRSLELDMTQAHVLFKLFDRDGNGEVSFDEFLAGCLRLKGGAKSLEVNMLLYESKRLFTKVSEFMEVVAEQLPSQVASSRFHRRRFSVLPFHEA